MDNAGQAARGHRRSLGDPASLTRRVLQRRQLAPCVRQVTLPVRDNPPLANPG